MTPETETLVTKAKEWLVHARAKIKTLQDDLNQQKQVAADLSKKLAAARSEINQLHIALKEKTTQLNA